MAAPESRVGADRLYQQLHGFVRFLRARGWRLGIGSETAFLDGLSLIDLTNRSNVREVGRSTLAKSPREAIEFDALFHRYWNGAMDRAADISPPPPREPRERGASGDAPGAARGERQAPEAERSRRAGRYSPEATAPGHLLLPVKESELRTALAGARRLRRAVATRPGRRQAHAEVGSIDPRATARRAVREGGEWIRLCLRERRPARAELVVLWDVSGSMREHLSGLFALVYALKRVIRATRIFAFGTSIEELTDAIVAEPYRWAVARVERRLDLSGGGTQIARCLSEFRRRWGEELRPGTTLLILSDGWDSGESGPLARELEQLWTRSYRLLWVNPYAADPWFVPATEALVTARPWIDRLTSPVDFPRSRPGGGGRRPIPGV